MKKSELEQIIKEEIQTILSEVNIQAALKYIQQNKMSINMQSGGAVYNALLLLAKSIEGDNK